MAADLYSESSLLRLRGTINGHERTFALPAGIHRVGSSRQADLHLPVAGVSRRHARLVVQPGSLVVEDLGSTNGTRLDGKRVERAEVPIGSELRFGPVGLVVESAAREEIELAIVLEPSREVAEVARPLSSFDPEPSTLLVDDWHLAEERGPVPIGLWLRCLEGVAECLIGSPGYQHGPESALAFLGEHLGVEGCCAVHWTSDDEPVALAAWGEVHEVLPLSEVRRLSREQAEPSPWGPRSRHCRSALFQTTPPLSAGLFIPTPEESAQAAGWQEGRGEAFGLMIWGAYPGRRSSGALLRTLTLLIAGLEAEGLGTGTHRAITFGPYERHGLVFPPGYYPGTSPPMVALYDQMRLLARSEIPVLITGETGVGKEQIARILHDSSRHREGPYVAVNCAAIPTELLEAEMFGIGKGVATGVEARPGKFELAQSGTLFLDEIAEMSPTLQAKLLRTLQEKEIQPLGGRSRAIDVRVIAATNVDLRRSLASGDLRRDLYYRLTGSELAVPALCRCADDIHGLVAHFLRRFSAEAGIRIRGMTVAAQKSLKAYRWPGNIRELENEIRRLVYTASPGEILGHERLSAHILHPEDPGRAGPVESLISELDSLEMKPLAEALEMRLIREALRRTRGVKVEACRLLGLSRNGLDKKMRRYGIEVDQQ